MTLVEKYSPPQLEKVDGLISLKKVIYEKAKKLLERQNNPFLCQRLDAKSGIYIEALDDGLRIDIDLESGKRFRRLQFDKNENFSGGYIYKFVFGDCGAQEEAIKDELEENDFELVFEVLDRV